MQTRVEKHAKLRDDLLMRLIGNISIAPQYVAPAVAEVQSKTGIAPPSWFNASGVTLAQVNAISVAQRAGR